MRASTVPLTSKSIVRLHAGGKRAIVRKLETMPASDMPPTLRSTGRLRASGEQPTRRSIGRPGADIIWPIPRKSGKGRAPITALTQRSNANVTGSATSVNAIFCERLGKRANLKSGGADVGKVLN